MGKTALIVVDAQNDYQPDGILGFPGSDSIIEPLVEFGTLAADVVIASRNQRPSNHESFASESHGGHWPANCIKGTKGAALVPDIAAIADYVVTKGLRKDQGGYTAFEAGTLRPLKSLEDILADEKVTHIAVGGYWLEWCVAQTAFDANALGYPTAVELTATQSLATRPGQEDQIRRLQKAGIVCV
jgi:nicotinamidase/pyrazinamidase